jgi:ribosomal protein L1
MDESSSVEIQIQQGLEDMRIEDKMAFVDDQIDLPKSPGRTVDMSALIGFDSDGDIHEFSQEHQRSMPS